MIKAIVWLFRTMIGHRPDLEDNPEKLEEYREATEYRKRVHTPSVQRAQQAFRFRRPGGRSF